MKFKGKTPEQIKQIKDQEKKLAAKKIRPSSARPAPQANKSSSENSPVQPSAKDDAKLMKRDPEAALAKEAADKGVSVDVLRSIIKPLRKEREIVEAVLHLVHDVKMTNDPQEIMRIYQQNKARCSIDVQGGESEVNRILHDFFSNDNTVQRLVLFRDVVNKSKRKGDVPLYQFYINMMPEERLLNLVHKSNKIIVDLKPEEKVVITEGREPKDQMPLD